MSTGTKSIPAKESFMWFSFIYISLLVLHKTHTISYVRAHEKSSYIPLLPTYTHRRTHTNMLSGSYIQIYHYRLLRIGFTVRNNVKRALSLECTSEATLHCGSAPLNAPPAGSLATSWCLLWQNKLCQTNGKLCRDFVRARQHLQTAFDMSLNITVGRQRCSS